MLLNSPNTFQAQETTMESEISCLYIADTELQAVRPSVRVGGSQGDTNPTPVRLRVILAYVFSCVCDMGLGKWTNQRCPWRKWISPTKFQQL